MVRLPEDCGKIARGKRKWDYSTYSIHSRFYLFSSKFPYNKLQCEFKSKWLSGKFRLLLQTQGNSKTEYVHLFKFIAVFIWEKEIPKLAVLKYLSTNIFETPWLEQGSLFDAVENEKLRILPQWQVMLLKFYFKSKAKCSWHSS